MKKNRILIDYIQLAQYGQFVCLLCLPKKNRPEPPKKNFTINHCDIDPATNNSMPRPPSKKIPRTNYSQFFLNKKKLIFRTWSRIEFVSKTAVF